VKIGIFGGTFNPPHQGHLLAAREAVQTLGLDLLYVVPAGTPPHKPLPEDTPDSPARYRLVQLMFEGEPKVQVLDMELGRPGPSYTVDTVEEICRRHPGVRPYLLLGTDAFLELTSWYRAEDLLALVIPAVFARGEGQAEAIAREAEVLETQYGASPVCVDHQVLEISSTYLREALSARGGAEFVGEAVYGELVRGRHYGTKPAFPWLREKVFSIAPRRQAHTLGTEMEVATLAERWGADAAEAREAAILHDVTKGLDRGEQLRLCEKYGMMPDAVESENPKLLHAMTGAGWARDEFGVNDAVFDAILYHTTGRPDMTLLDKIIYIADYIEPNRDFPGLDALRDMAYTDLDAAVAYGLALTAEQLEEKGAAVHPRSREAAQWFAARRR